MGTRHAFLHNHNLVGTVSANFTATFIQFIVSGLGSLTGNYDDFIFGDIFQVQRGCLFGLLGVQSADRLGGGKVRLEAFEGGLTRLLGI